MNAPTLFDRSGADLQPREQTSEFNVGEWMHVLRRRWLLLALACAIGLAAASVHYAMTPKLYVSTAVLQIERRSLTPLVGSQTPWLEDWWNMEYYPTQYKLLESRGLAERVVRNLRLTEDPFFNPGGKPLANIAATEVIEAGEAAAPTAGADLAALGGLADRLRNGLTVEPIRTTQLVTLTYRSTNPEFAARAVNGFADAFIDWGIENRSTTAGNASHFLSSQIDTLKKEIQDKETQLQDVSRTSSIVELDSGSNVTMQRLEALNKSYSDALRNRIEREARYRELLSAPMEAIAESQSDGLVTELKRKQLDLERDYEIGLKTYKKDFPKMLELQTGIEKGRQHLAGVVEEMVDKARKAAYAEFQTALRQERALEQEMRGLKTEVLDESSASAEYRNLSLEADTRRNLLDEVLKAQSETEVTARLQGTRESNVRIVDRALTPGGPASPNLKQDLSSGLLVGLLIGLGIVLLLEYLDRSVKSAEQVERLLGLPALAVIPDISDTGSSYGGYRAYGGYGGYGSSGSRSAGAAGSGAKDSGAKDSEGKGSRRWLDKARKPDSPGRIELVPHEGPRLAVSEAYRSLRTALLLSTAHELRVVAVTSAVASEGKSATATNLAVVMAQLGRRVLLVDADLRKPRLHEVMQVSNRAGLVSFLTGGADFESVVRGTTVQNLSVIPSGPIPPNPSELLASDRMRDLVKLARSRFDFVVIDTPPILPVTDAALVGTLVDGVTLCLRAGKVTRDEARSCLDRLNLSGIKVLGVVLNRHKASQGGYSGRRYQMYETYGSAASEPKADSAA
ncbi:MAG TPA: polysaccharide biosynthesis tyrosine autokinase [Thermoanaerobaculia bacterium]|nr:polysaccharide biosynthesis tyrosine autokinase [Thermoanaerobaculia bacterium]